MNLLLRNYLHHNLYDQVCAAKPVEGASVTISLIRLINWFRNQNSPKVPTTTRLRDSTTTWVSCLVNCFLPLSLSLSLTHSLSLSVVCRKDQSHSTGIFRGIHASRSGHWPTCKTCFTNLFDHSHPTGNQEGAHLVGRGVQADGQQVCRGCPAAPGPDSGPRDLSRPRPPTTS